MENIYADETNTEVDIDYYNPFNVLNYRRKSFIYIVNSKESTYNAYFIGIKYSLRLCNI